MARDVLSVVCLAAVIVSNSGCGEAPQGGANVKLAEGGGVVKYNGSPLAGASVTFLPASGPVASGTTDLNGKFKLSTGGVAGVAVGKCKVTVTAIEGGGKPAASETSIAMPTSKPANPEEMKKKMEAMGPGMQSASGDEAAKPKSLIPEIYGKSSTTTLEQTVDSDASKNDFVIELKD